MKENKEKMIAMNQQGISYSKIGKVFDGISRQRVHQIIKDYESPFASPPISVPKKKTELDPDPGIILTNMQKWQLKNLRSRNNTTQLGREYKREMIRIYFKHTCQNTNCNKKWKEGERRFDVHHFSCDPNDTRKYDKGKIEDIINSVTLLCHKCHLNLPEFKEKQRSIMIEKIREQIRKEKSKI